ncbi:MAG: FadR family transcriptional regulator [Zoogloeaceae bacterium]|jgi:GntR family transcriptional repressor for pyruvate dehydrogenase complex|nr:FadR family transcriptional regulator [Zoogloeaceae bacterium]
MSSRKVSETVAETLERRLLEGALRPGDRLPSERELALELGVSRPSLREAIQKLASRGLLQSRQGGGTFVTNRLTSGFSDPWQAMLETRLDVREDVLEMRRTLEMQAVEWAASRRTEADMISLEHSFAALEAAFSSAPENGAEGGIERLADCDRAFHQSLADAAHNTLLAHLCMTLLHLLRETVSFTLAELGKVPRAYPLIVSQYAALLAAIRAQRPTEARTVAAAHLDFVGEGMAGAWRALAVERAAKRGFSSPNASRAARPSPVEPEAKVSSSFSF